VRTSIFLAAAKARPPLQIPTRLFIPMERLEKSIDVEVPLSTAYNQWTQFKEFPHFMDGVQEVRQIDDTHLFWRADIAGKTAEWEAEIYEQVPDSRIAWRSTSGAPNAGAVSFQELEPNLTRVNLIIDYQPLGAVEKIGDALGLVSGKVEGDLQRFKDFIEKRGRESGSWRGEVHQ
jgi:uncharacterized membrane protein